MAKWTTWTGALSRKTLGLQEGVAAHIRGGILVNLADSVF